MFTSGEWDQLVADHRPPNVLLVAIDGTVGVVGYTAVHPEEGEMFLLFVRPAYPGRGIGRTLLAAAHDALRAAGCAEAFSSCTSRTSRRSSFTRRAGTPGLFRPRLGLPGHAPARAASRQAALDGLIALLRVPLTSMSFFPGG
jgi:GNAT superfamily N-acetyltransferase